MTSIPALVPAPRCGARGVGRRDLRVPTSDGVRLAVRDHGPLTPAHTVVFLHGFCLGSITWARQIAYLRRRHGNALRVIAYDHRGHGLSDPAPLQSCRIDQLAADLAAVLTALNVSGPVTLVGHSMGAMTVLAYLARPAHDRPVDPDGLVLVGTAAGHLTERGLGRLLGTPVTSALVALVAHTPSHLLKVLAGPMCAALGRWYGCGAAERATVATLAANALARTPITTAVGFLPSLRDWDQTAALSAIRARTIVISGGNDVLTPSAHADELAAAIPGAVHVRVPDAGHMLPQQAPAVIDDAIHRVMTIHDGVARPLVAALSS